MKKLILLAGVLACATLGFAQGTVVFNNRISGTVITRVYYSYSIGANLYGNGPDDYPVGTRDWTGFSLCTGSGWRAAIRAANGADVPTSALSFGLNPTTTTFRTGTAAGGFAVTTATLNSVAKDAAVATLQIFVWNAATGITDPAQALQAYQYGSLLAGFSKPFNLQSIGGDVNTPPNLVGLESFGFGIPEPASISILALGFVVFCARRLGAAHPASSAC